MLLAWFGYKNLRIYRKRWKVLIIMIFLPQHKPFWILYSVGHYVPKTVFVCRSMLIAYFLLIWVPYPLRIKIYLGVTFGKLDMSRDMTSLVTIATKCYLWNHPKWLVPSRWAQNADQFWFIKHISNVFLSKVTRV